MMEPVFAKASEERPLAALLEVYQQRMHVLQAGLQPLLNERQHFDHLFQLLCADVALVSMQREAWEQQWRQWTREGGMVRHGRSCNARHQQLADLEKLLATHHAKLEEKRADIRQKITCQYRLILRQQQKMKCVKEWLALVCRGKNAVAQRRESGADEERVLAQWFGTQRELRA